MLTSTGSSSYTARSMSLICSRRPSGAQLTDFFFFTVLVKLVVAVAVVAKVDDVGWRGVGVTEGDSLRAFAIDFKASWKGSSEDGCAMLVSGSFFTGTGAFLKLGSFGLGFGAEKNDESDLASLIAPAFVGVVVDFVVCVTAAFFAGGPIFGGGSDGFLFFVFVSGDNPRKSREQNGIMDCHDLPSKDSVSPPFFEASSFELADAICRHLRSRFEAMSLTAAKRYEQGEGIVRFKLICLFANDMRESTGTASRDGQPRSSGVVVAQTGEHTQMLTRYRSFLGQFYYDLPQSRFPEGLKGPGQSVDYLTITAFRYFHR